MNEKRIGRSRRSRLNKQPHMGGVGPYHLHPNEQLIELVISYEPPDRSVDRAPSDEDVCCSVRFDVHGHKQVDSSPPLKLTRAQAREAAILFFEFAQG